ncbi:hypothetical protein [Fischerella thermalis]|nr:hypothetical protein [Fischerella thermalis]
MQVLHPDLKAVDGNYVDLRYFVNNPNQISMKGDRFVSRGLYGYWAAVV